MIEVVKLSKRYLILPKRTFQRLYDLYLAIFKAQNSQALQSFTFSREHQALKELTFSINSGDVVGVIGLNGSGKSTFLKILSGHLSASSGNLSCDPDNIQLIDESNVSLQNDLSVQDAIKSSLIEYTGSKKSQLLHDILTYFDLDSKQLDKVSTLSLGTKARLFFAIATISTRPILLIDETLGAGDPYWVNKCYLWLKNICSHKTVLMTSHDTQLLQKFCQKSIWIDNGTIREYGETQYVSALYEAYANSLSFTGITCQTEKSEIQQSSSNIKSLKIRSNNRLIITSCSISYQQQTIRITTPSSPPDTLENLDLVTNITLSVGCNSSGNYWPTALFTFWSFDGCRLFTLQNKSFSVEMKASSHINISFENFKFPEVNKPLLLSVSLFSSQSMLTSLEEISREDLWHKFILFSPNIRCSKQLMTAKPRSPFFNEEICEIVL